MLLRQTWVPEFHRTQVSWVSCNDQRDSSWQDTMLRVLRIKLIETHSQIFYEGRLLSSTIISILVASFRFYSHLEKTEVLSGNICHRVPTLLFLCLTKSSAVSPRKFHTLIWTNFCNYCPGDIPRLSGSGDQQDLCLQSHGTVYFCIP